MNLQLWTMVSLENSIIQIISFHITWFIYKKLTRSTLAYWKVFCLSLLGIVVSLGKGDGFYCYLSSFGLKGTAGASFDALGKPLFWSFLGYFYRFICDFYSILCIQ